MNTRIKIKKLAETDASESCAVKAKYGDERYIIHNKIQPDSRAALACLFVERWAMVAAAPDGEDSAGRQKLRNLTPKELADRACELVEVLYTQFAERGWLMNVPPFEQALQSVMDDEEKE